ncbi:uncharacterized protein [Hoplias malabaricus]|uniref:uncharacterized protein n=1 Tax=Hoplias malabaricus TaxID=27720 RepID=UPI0034618F93
MERVDEKEEEKDNRDDGCQKTWQPSFYIKVDKEIYYYAGHEISIWQSLDSYGAIIWPAALALCEYLDMNRETVNLLDKAVLELGAGTGLVSIVASLLGAWVTASDLPEVLGNLRSNLSRNTRGRCRYTPQVAEIFWDHELKEIFPRSVYRYDYILAADVVYHHDFLSELLATMRHFCQPGTTLIWSNKVRFESDLVFLKKFKAAFNTTLLADTGEVQIYSATTKESEEVRNFVLIPLENAEEKGDEKEEEEEVQGNTEEFYSGDSSNGKKQDQNSTDSVSKSIVDVEEFNEDVWVKDKEVSSSKNEEQEQYEELELDKSASVEGNPVTEKQKNDQEETKEEERVTNEKSCQLKSKESEDVGSALASEMEKSDSQNSETNAHILIQRSWAPRVYYKLDKEIHYFMGHKITIQESIDSYGGVIWPAAVALCKFLETPVGREHINLFDKETLELGAGTGLLSVVATLLGAKVTATDLPELLGNLKCNLNRNTRGHWRYEPQVAVLSWGHELEQTFPHSEHHYDYVLAADVVYHHDFLDQLLDTMYYLCQPGTNLIWANKVRYKSDLIFTENFKKAFHTTLITELDEVRIYLATHREPGLEEREKRNVQINEKEDLKNQDYKEGSESQRIQRDGQSPSEDTQHEKVYSSSIKEDKELDTKEKQSEEAGLQKERDEEHKAQKKEDKENTEGMDYEESIKDCSGSESISSAQTVEQSSQYNYITNDIAFTATPNFNI